jgi:SAM-dependent methyltransferase
MLLSLAMSDDAARLWDFYATPLGQLARRVIARRIRERWPDVRGMDVIGLGYASPYLRIFHSEARLTAALMPQSQGVVQWPREGPYRAALVPEIGLPLRDNSAERVLAIHSLEHVDARQDYLSEIRRVLMPHGRVIVAVPNRRGAWAALDTTPFGHGRPYSVGQIEKLLRKASLDPVGVSPCLFAPPFRARALPWAALAWERVGKALWPAFAGVVIVEAIKLVHAEVRVPAKKPAFAPVPALGGLSTAPRKSMV